MDEYQAQSLGQGISRDPLSISSSSLMGGGGLCGTKREPVDAVVIKQEYDEIATLSGKTRLVSPKPSARHASGGTVGSVSSADSPTSPRRSRSPIAISNGHSSLGSINGLERVTPNPVAGPSTISRHQQQSQHQQPQQQQQPSQTQHQHQHVSGQYVDSPMQMYPHDALPQNHNSLAQINTAQAYSHSQSHAHHQSASTQSPGSHIDHSPEMTRFYAMGMSPHEATNHWSQEPASINMGYMPMQTDPIDNGMGLGMHMGNTNGMGMSAVGMTGAQYGYDYSSDMTGMRHGQPVSYVTAGNDVHGHHIVHSAQGGYMQSPTSVEISQDILDDAWRRWSAQFT